jgi:hypothetical protein
VNATKTSAQPWARGLLPRPACSSVHSHRWCSWLLRRPACRARTPSARVARRILPTSEPLELLSSAGTGLPPRWSCGEHRTPWRRACATRLPVAASSQGMP